MYRLCIAACDINHLFQRCGQFLTKQINAGDILPHVECPLPSAENSATDELFSAPIFYYAQSTQCLS
jgi:hypothetical protein